MRTEGSVSGNSEVPETSEFLGNSEKNKLPSPTMYNESTVHVGYPACYLQLLGGLPQEGPEHLLDCRKQGDPRVQYRVKYMEWSTLHVEYIAEQGNL